MLNETFVKMNDVELLRIIKDETSSSRKKNDCMTVLYNRYEKQIWKNWWRLQSEMHNSQMILNMKDEYFLMAQEAFCVAISKIDMSRVEDEKFKCVGMINWYLLNVRTKIRKEIVKITSRTKSTSDLMCSDNSDSMDIDPDVEQSYWNNEGYMTDPSYVVEENEKEEKCNEIIDNGLSKWSEEEKRIFNLLKNGVSKEEICTIEGKTSREISNCIKKIRTDVKKAVGF